MLLLDAEKIGDLQSIGHNTRILQTDKLTNGGNGNTTARCIVYGVRYSCWRAIKIKQTKNKSITSEAMQYWQDIVTRMPTTRVELMTPKSNHRKYLAQVCGRFFLRFWKISAANLRILWLHILPELMIKQRRTSSRLQAQYSRLFNLGEMSCFKIFNWQQK